MRFPSASGVEAALDVVVFRFEHPLIKTQPKSKKQNVIRIAITNRVSGGDSLSPEARKPAV